MKLFAVLLLLSLGAQGALPKAECETVQKQLKSGDLIFIDTNIPVLNQVAQATKTWTSHLGIAWFEKGRWLVAESYVPASRKVPLCSFLGRYFYKGYSIRRWEHEWTQSDSARFSEGIDRRLKIPYDLWFNYDSKFQFCSKFVYDLFLENFGIEIGQIETFADLRAANPDFDTRFFEAWFGGKIPWNQRVVTPASQLRDPKLVVIREVLNK